jgi:hypothetical protein
MNIIEFINPGIESPFGTVKVDLSYPNIKIINQNEI